MGGSGAPGHHVPPPPLTGNCLLLPGSLSRPQLPPLLSCPPAELPGQSPAACVSLFIFPLLNVCVCLRLCLPPPHTLATEAFTLSAFHFLSPALKVQFSPQLSRGPTSILMRHFMLAAIFVCVRKRWIFWFGGSELKAPAKAGENGRMRSGR